MQLLGIVQVHMSWSIKGQESSEGAPTSTKVNYISAAVGTSVTQGSVTAYSFHQQCRKWGSAGNINVLPWRLKQLSSFLFYSPNNFTRKSYS